MQRSPVPFSAVLDALGALDTEPVESSRHWEMFRVRYPTPAGFKPASYLSLSYDCPFTEATSRNHSAWKSLSGAARSYSVVVTNRSRLTQDLERVAKEFRGLVATTSRDLLFDNVVSAFMPRADNIEERPYFIEPDVKLPNQSTRPALTYLTGLLGSGLDSQSQIGAEVLIAAAGLGKTTLSRAIARKILASKRKAIPILVESAQWQNLINLTLPNILNAALLQLIPDAVRLTNPKLFQLLVREQLLVPIFDGFDELCVHPHATYNPATLIAELLDLVGNTGARLLITTRETFWAKHGSGFPTDRIQPLSLQGFSNEQRKQFFFKRLKLPEERDIAARLTREIGERLYEGEIARQSLQADRASGVPLFLELIALYVDGNPAATFAPASKDPLGPLLEAVCERENVRQQLQISAQKQMGIFEDLFRDFAEDITRADLATYVEILAPGVTRDALIRFESHAFFSPGVDVRPRFESLRVYFIARWLANRLEEAVEGSTSEAIIGEWLERNAKGNTDVFDFLLMRFVVLERAKAKAAISHALRMIAGKPKWEGASSALFHLAQRLAIREENTKEGRTRVLLEYLGLQEAVKALAVQGQISGLDFEGIKFESCVFRDVEFHNCNFSSSTEFLRCKFDGDLTFENSRNAGQVKLVGCSLSEAAEDEWDAQAGRASRKVVTETVVREALRDILRKFFGPYGFSSIKEADAKTGPIARSPCRDAAWNELFKEGILDRHHISGVSGGGLNVAHSAEAKHEVRNFLDNAALGPKLQMVVRNILARG